MDNPVKNELAHPHDLLVHNILADADIAADLLRNYLDPELVAAVDLDSLRRESGDTVSSKLSKLVGDLRYSARFTDGKEKLNVFVVLEHQSRPDRWMSFRMLDYICAEYRQRIPAMKKAELLPYPLAVVLHHGPSPWKRIAPMRELIARQSGVPDDILGLPLCLIDAAALPLDDLYGHPVVCALLDSLQSASMGTLPSRMRGIISRLRGLPGKEGRTKPWALALAKYYAAVQGKVRNGIDDLAEIFAELYNWQEAEKMATTMYEAIQEEGVAKGRAEGRAEGIATGRMESLITILESRFHAVPPTLRRKLKNLRDVDHIVGLLQLAATCRDLKEFQQSV